jgi:hypothetical protein
MRLETPNWLAPKAGARVRHWSLRRVDPWSALKFALLFYLSMAIVMVLTSLLLYFVASALDVRKVLEGVVQSIGWAEWRLTAGGVLWFTSLLGVAGVIIWTGMTVSLVLLYNLVCNVAGGLEFTVTDKDA